MGLISSPEEFRLHYNLAESESGIVSPHLPRGYVRHYACDADIPAEISAFLPRANTASLAQQQSTGNRQ